MRKRSKNRFRRPLPLSQMTGIPMESRARSQSNLVLRNLEGFRAEFRKFSNTVVPMFWAEYVIRKLLFASSFASFSLQNQVGLPFYISSLMYFTVRIVEPFQSYFSGALLVTGVAVLSLGVRALRRGHLETNRALRFEGEFFLTKDQV